MYNIIRHSHSGLMWLIIVMLVISVIVSLIAMFKKQETPTPFSKVIFQTTKWMVYLQFVMGVALLFLSSKVHYETGFMKSGTLRFYGMEHPLLMLVATGLMAMGLYFAKRKPTSFKKNRSIVVYFSIALIIIVMMVPWNTVLA
ncbi:MAG: hypothetical protein GXO88_07365 [Chlorobi bacterium]|nr:hypothetical protein [Chlorobiota bacterium]